MPARILRPSLLLCLLSCAGYRLEERDNPLAAHGVRSLAIPQFVNTSAMPGVAEVLTGGIVRLFSKYPGLDLRVGEDPGADAVLVGIVSGPRTARETTAVTQSRLVEGSGGRRAFVVPTQASYGLTVRIMIVKDPAHAMRPGTVPEVVVHETLRLEGVHDVMTGESFDGDSPGTVNATRNRSLVRLSVARAAEDLVRDFEGRALHAF